MTSPPAPDSMLMYLLHFIAEDWYKNDYPDEESASGEEDANVESDGSGDCDFLCVATQALKVFDHTYRYVP